MQEGIHILNKTAVMEMPAVFGVAIFIGIALALISFVIVLVVDNLTIIIVSGVTMLIGIILVIFSPIVGKEVDTGRYRYEVTIDPAVKFSDIYNNYEVIKQRGDIWVLEDLDRMECNGVDLECIGSGAPDNIRPIYNLKIDFDENPEE